MSCCNSSSCALLCVFKIMLFLSGTSSSTTEAETHVLHNVLPCTAKDAIDCHVQVSQYNFTRPKFQAGTGEFTQLVWKSTTKVGCAVNTQCDWTMYVCHYSAAGREMTCGHPTCALHVLLLSRNLVHPASM